MISLLLANPDDASKMDWSETTTTAQRNWIGRSEGAEITFEIDWDPDDAITVFTTRPDTVFGATFLVLAPEHPLVERLTTTEQRAEVEAYRKAAAAKDLQVGQRVAVEAKGHADALEASEVKLGVAKPVPAPAK